MMGPKEAGAPDQTVPGFIRVRTVFQSSLHILKAYLMLTA